MDKNRRQKILLGIIGSILFHLILFILFLFSGMNLFFSPIPREAHRQIKVTLKKPEPVLPPQEEQIIPQKSQFFELVDNPNANKQTPQKGNFLSDQSSVSASHESSDKTRLPDNPSEKMPTSSGRESNQRYAFREGMKSPYKTFSRGLLVPDRSEPSNDAEKKEKPSSQIPSTTSASDYKDPQIFDPQQVGAFALNTYAWEYAPYMKKWLRYLRQHWVAPPAYSQLGLISGATIVKFRIFPDGHMEAFQVLEHEGHKSLLISSKNAIHASFPFRPLPKDFPEKYLEITLKMIYPDLRQLAR